MEAGPDPVFGVILDDPRTALRPPRGFGDLREYRDRLDAPMAAVRGPAMHSVETVSVGTSDRAFALRTYEASAEPHGTVLFIHGGGFVIGSLATHDALCRSLALATGARVVAVDYSLAPERPYPAGHDDCLTALSWAAETAEPGSSLALCGDSAGGYLAVDVALRATHRVCALGLLYPVVDPACASGSWERYGTGHVLTREWMRWAWTAYIGASAGESSLLHADLGRLPPTRIITAACDPLRDEGEELAAAIVLAGGSATVTRAGGMIHGFASLPMLTARAGHAVDDIGRHLHQHMR